MPLPFSFKALMLLSYHLLPILLIVPKHSIVRSTDLTRGIYRSRDRMFSFLSQADIMKEIRSLLKDNAEIPSVFL